MQRANQVPFVMISAERQCGDDDNRTAALREALEIFGFRFKRCLGHFDGAYENSFAVFIHVSNGVDGLSEHDTLRALCDLGMHFEQDSILFVGPADNNAHRQAYLLEQDQMAEIVADDDSDARVSGQHIGAWKAVPMVDRHAYGDFTLDLSNPNDAYIVA